MTRIDNDLIEKVKGKAQTHLRRKQPTESRVQDSEDIANEYFLYCFENSIVDIYEDEQMDNFMSSYINNKIKGPYFKSIENDISNNQSFDDDDWFAECWNAAVANPKRSKHERLGNDAEESTDDDTTESTSCDAEESTDDDTTESTSRDAEESTDDTAKSITDDDVQKLIDKNVFVQTFEGIYVGKLLEQNDNSDIKINGFFSEHKDGLFVNESSKENDYYIQREKVTDLCGLSKKGFKNYLKHQVDNFKIPIKKLIEHGDYLKKIIQFNRTLSAYEQFVFVNHLPYNAIAIKIINGPYNYYPTIENTTKNTFINALSIRINNLDGKNKPLFWNLAKDKKKPKQEEIKEINEKYSEKIKKISENSDISDSLEKYQEILREVAKMGDPYEEMIFFNIRVVVDFIGKLTESLSAMKEKDEYEKRCRLIEYHNTVKKRYKRTRINKDKTFLNYANILNKEEKPSWLDDTSWNKLCNDPIVQKMRTSNSPVTFTPEDIATTKARLKERYDIFCGKALRKKKGKKASS